MTVAVKPRSAIVVTGVARHSLGEAFVQAYAARNSASQIITIDHVSNPRLAKIENVRQLIFDLNPLSSFCGNADGYSSSLDSTLSEAISAGDCGGVDWLLQCAGAYDYGPFTAHDSDHRSQILGLNVVAVAEVLYCVMTLNKRLDRANEGTLGHILIGSWQALHARSQRPLYAASKAFGIDFCTSLTEGQELETCIYLASGPLDTPMQHRNHWVRKAGGSERFFETVLAGTSELYRSIFIGCDSFALDEALRQGFYSERTQLLGAMTEYKKVRRQAQCEMLGVLSPSQAADVLVGMVANFKSCSGIYGLRRDPEGRAALTRAHFSDLNRRTLFESVAKPASWMGRPTLP